MKYYLATVKFDPDSGFVHGNSQILAEDEVIFSFEKGLSKTNRLEVKAPDHLQLWMKSSAEGKRIREGDEIIIGNKTLCFKYMLNNEKVGQEKQQSSVQLPLCKDTEAECRFCL